MIQNPASGLVIDVEGASTKLVDEQGKSVTPTVYTTPPVQPPPK